MIQAVYGSLIAVVNLVLVNLTDIYNYLEGKLIVQYALYNYGMMNLIRKQ